MLNLPIDNPFFFITLLVTRCKKQDAVLKNALCVQFNCHRKKYNKYNFFECFVKSNVCVLLNAFYGSCLSLYDIAICTENTLCVFKILSIHLAIPRHATDK